MSSARIRIDTRGLDAMIKSLKGFRTEGIAQAQRELDAALARAAETSRGLAHEHDGALRASQSTRSDHGPTHWTGEVTYSARGAAFELQRGGDHAAYIDDLTARTEADFAQAIDAAFDNL